MKNIPIGQCCEILDSQRIPITASNRKKGPYPYYGANGIQDYVDNYIFDDELVLLAEDGGNFGSHDRPIAYRVSGKCWVNNHAHVLKPKKGLNVDYLCYALMFYNVNSFVNGATRMKLTQAAMRQMTIPLLDLKDQLNIVKQLSSIQDIIKNHQQQLSALDEIIKSRFIEMFGNPMISTKYPLEAIVNIGRVLTGCTPSTKESKYYDSNEIMFIKPSDINEDVVTKIEKSEAFISNNARSVARIFPSKSVLVTCIGTIGKVGFSITEGSCNQQINVIVPNETTNYLYLSYTLLYMKKRLEKLANAPVVPIINKGDFSKISIPIPPIKLQEQFAAFVQQYNKSKDAIKKSLCKTQLLFDSLMQKYFG